MMMMMTMVMIAYPKLSHKLAANPQDFLDLLDPQKNKILQQSHSNVPQLKKNIKKI